MITGQQYLFSRRRILRAAAILCVAPVLTLSLSACGSGASGRSTGEVGLEIGADGENLRFDHTELAAPAGHEVSLTFTNHSRSLRHNWVLVDGGKDVADQVYAAGQEAGLDHGFVPVDRSSVLVATGQVDGGQSETLTLTTPGVPGDYFYICTTPGHYLAGMHGVLTITQSED